MRVRSLVIALLLGAVGVQARAADFDKSLAKNSKRVLAKCSSREDSLNILQTAALVRIVDSSFYFARLRRADSPEEFETLARGLRDDNPEAWAEFDRRFAYAKSRCATDIHAHNPDVRWQSFLRLGPPSSEWSIPSECEGIEGKTCISYVYTWNDWGREVVCQTDPGGGYPVREVLGTFEDDESRRPVFPIVQPLVFPNADSTYQLWVSVWIRGSDFTLLSLVDNILRLELTLADGTGAIAGTDSLLTDLSILRSVLSVARDKSEVVAMAYLSCDDLPRGRYALALRVIGSGANAGSHRMEIDIPSRYASRGASDLLALAANVPQGTDVLPGIVRGDESLYADPIRVYDRGGKIRLYEEIEAPWPPADTTGCILTLTARPVSGEDKRKRGDVLVGPIIDVRDETGRLWNPAESPANVPPNGRDPDEESTILHEAAYHPTGPRSAIALDVPLAGLKRGEYWLQCSIQDRAGRFFKTALTAVTVR